MTNLNIIPNFDKKTAKFEGAIAAGENIHVNISNIGGYIVGTENLRLRAVGSKGETLAQFPLLGDEGLNWVKDGDTIECDLNLNTVQMLDAVPPAARVMVLFVLDNPEDETLYFKSFVSVDHWPRRVGEDEPVDLGGYTDFVQETLRSIESIEDRVDEAEKIATDAQESASGSVKSAAAYAEAAKGYAQKANDVLKGAATKEEVVAVNKSLVNKADTEDVWLRGDDVTGDTNFAQSIKVNKIEALDDESDIKFDAPIVSNTVNYGGENEPAFAVIDGNMIQAFSHDGDSNSDLIICGRSFRFQGNSYDVPSAPPELYTEGDILCDGAIITSEIEDENGHIQNITIKNNEISAHFTEEEYGWINWGTIVLNGSVQLRNGGLYSYDSPITASSFDSYMYYVSNGGALVFNSYDEFGSTYETTLDALVVENLSSNSWYVQENLRGHITHDIGYDDLWGNYGGIVTITPTDEYGGYSDFCFYSNGGLSMSGGLRATDLSCDGYVSCYDLQASLGVYANSYIEKSWSEEFDDSYYGGFSVTDTYDQDITSKLIAGKLRIEKYFYDGESDGYYDYVDMGIDIENGLSLSLSHEKRKLTFSFSDFATLRTMIDEYNASKGA